jgi:hypothetical protein
MRRRVSHDDSSEESEYMDSDDGSIDSETYLTDLETCSNEEGEQPWLFTNRDYSREHYPSTS